MLAKINIKLNTFIFWLVVAFLVGNFVSSVIASAIDRGQVEASRAEIEFDRYVLGLLRADRDRLVQQQSDTQRRIEDLESTISGFEETGGRLEAIALRGDEYYKRFIEALRGIRSAFGDIREALREIRVGE